MQIQDLTRSYQSKTDEELLQLAANSEQLTPEAHSVLTSELANAESTWQSIWKRTSTRVKKQGLAGYRFRRTLVESANWWKRYSVFIATSSGFSFFFIKLAGTVAYCGTRLDGVHQECVLLH